MADVQIASCDNLIREALRLHDLEYSPYPIARKGLRFKDKSGIERVTTGKAPILAGWQVRKLSKNELLSEIKKHYVSGIGFCASSEKTVLDFDGEGHRGVYEYFLMELPELAWAPLVRTGSGKEHLHFACPGMPESFANQKFSRPDLKCIVELRGNRSNCALPPTTHPQTGRPYQWERDPEDFERPEIPFTTIHPWLAHWAGIQETLRESGSRELAKGPQDPLPLGSFACKFVLRGWPLGCPGGISQRHAVLRSTRNLLSAGFTVEEAFNGVWAGIENSPWDRSKGPWTKAEVRAIVEDLAQRPAPPLRELSIASSGIAHPSGLRVARIDGPIARPLSVSAEEALCRS